MREVWRQCYVSKTGSVYEVSHIGSIKNSTRGVILQGTVGDSKSSTRYRQVHCGDGKILYPHREVAKAFVPNPENKPFVNHRDNNPLNNNYLNLEWTTCKENSAHANALGQYLFLKQVNKLRRKFSDEIIRDIRESKESAKTLSRRYGCGLSTIGKIRRRETYKDVP